MSSPIASRKDEHIQACLDPESQYSAAPSGVFDRYLLEPEALPELALGEVDLRTTFLQKTLSAPILVSSMTGGPARGALINKHLAEAVEALGLGMGVGSERIAIADPSTRASFAVRPFAPSALILGNLGAVQLGLGWGAKEAQEAVDIAGADGLFLHLNAVQEAIQPGGDTDFRGIGQRITELVAAVPFPVLVKECGAGIGARAALRLHQAGVAAIDVSGAGGTSWAKVEGMRAQDPLARTLGDTFRNWGLPTPLALIEVRQALPRATLIASGGIRTGLDAAKALALGADLVSIAQPVLQAALEGKEAVIAVLERFIAELRIACFGAGARTPAELRARAPIRRL
ncbi:MAG: type 2 isopentenyl-diphosphate Delta-isomerase [Myxococcota bacterium]